MSNWLGNDADDKWQMWLYGVIAPLPIMGFALFWMFSRHADLSGPRSGFVLDGTDAVALGFTALFVAVALHIHFFWSLSERPILNRSYIVGRALSVSGAMMGLLYITWGILRR